MEGKGRKETRYFLYVTSQKSYTKEWRRISLTKKYKRANKGKSQTIINQYVFIVSLTGEQECIPTRCSVYMASWLLSWYVITLNKSQQRNGQNIERVNRWGYVRVYFCNRWRLTKDDDITKTMIYMHTSFFFCFSWRWFILKKKMRICDFDWASLYEGSYEPGKLNWFLCCKFSRWRKSDADMHAWCMSISSRRRERKKEIIK